MHGIVRVCRHRLGDQLYARWQGHLCGSCLALRDLSGQSSRVLTGYDGLLVSVLVEAQQGSLEMTQAGRCPLRGMRSIPVVASTEPAAKAVTAVALLGSAAVLADKRFDGDLPRGMSPVGERIERRLQKEGSRVAESVGLEPEWILDAPHEAAGRESESTDLLELLEPVGQAVGHVFAHSAELAGMPVNAAPLRRVGTAFGRLQHLLDAVEDLDDDRRHDRFNPLVASGTSLGQARETAESLVQEIRQALSEADLKDRALIDGLVEEMDHAVHRAFSSRRSATTGLALASAWVMIASPFRCGRGCGCNCCEDCACCCVGEECCG